MVVLTREQIEERLIALHRASLELVSNLSLEKVLERIINIALEEVGAQYAALGVLGQAGNFATFIPVGMSEEQISRLGDPPHGKGLLGAIATERRTIRIPDISLDPRRVGFPPDHPTMQSFLGVPILLGDKLLGQIYLTNKETYHEFTQDDERVIETLAAYAAVAITNAHLYEGLVTRDEQLTQRNEDLALLNDVATALASSMDVDEILDKTLNRVLAYLGVEAGEIFLKEEGEQVFKLALHRGASPEAFWTRDRFKPGEGFVGAAAEIGKPLVSTVPKEDMRFLRQALIDAGFQCIACIPMLARGSVVGVMGVATFSPRRLDDRELHLLSAIGTWAAITIENIRLHRQARRLAILEERDRIGMDLHDGIIQSIYSVGLALDVARLSLDDDLQTSRQKIDQAISGLNSTIADIRTYISDLRPRQFRGEDLIQGLQSLVDEFNMNTNAKGLLKGPQNGLIDLPAAHATALFHICQEALSNVAKHAQATRAEVRLWTTPERVLLEVSDDGIGFEHHKINNNSGNGLSNMHKRAHKVGGDVEITSELSEGTTVMAWVPSHS